MRSSKRSSKTWFQWDSNLPVIGEPKGESATLENLEGKDTEPIKSHLEGEYERKSD